jgi:hypothetical protein
VAFADLFSKFHQRRSVRFGLNLAIGDFLRSICNLRRAAVAMIHRDHFRDVVQFD